MASELAHALRRLAPPLLAAPDGWPELLALVWGPQFDRVHALRLAATVPGLGAGTLAAAAERFDGLGARRQDRLRQLIVRAGGRPCATIAHAPHPAD